MTKTFTALLCALSVFTSKAITITQDIDWGLQPNFNGFLMIVGDGNTRAETSVHAEDDGLGNFIPSAHEGIGDWPEFLARWLATKPNDAFTVRQTLASGFSEYSVSIADIFGGQYFIPTKVEYKTAMTPSDFGQLIFEGDYGQAPLPDGGNVAMMLGSVVALFISNRSLRRRY